MCHSDLAVLYLQNPQRADWLAAGGSWRTRAFEKTGWHTAQQKCQQQVQKMLVQTSELPGTMHAKTGSCLRAEDSDPDHGWFIGWIDWDKNRNRNLATTWFVISIIGEEARGWNAQAIALELLKELQP